jgi:hypothetical protein
MKNLNIKIHYIPINREVKSNGGNIARIYEKHLMEHIYRIQSHELLQHDRKWRRKLYRENWKESISKASILQLMMASLLQIAIYG